MAAASRATGLGVPLNPAWAAAHFRGSAVLRFDESQDRLLKVQRIEEPIDPLVQRVDRGDLGQMHTCRMPH
ncbi:hypothetical protein JNUCC0626_07830 [Lentzea sp. JNUCC 0626]|uniref:hypothetical protein n=1 Tax=Lentzea sp. JNUCC 0626 TaxID=3367513 RepID=UPI003747867E